MSLENLVDQMIVEGRREEKKGEWGIGKVNSSATTGKRWEHRVRWLGSEGCGRPVSVAAKSGKERRGSTLNPPAEGKKRGEGMNRTIKLRLKRRQK